MAEPVNIVDSRHPTFSSADWELWRAVYSAGDEFRSTYLERFSTREDPTDFEMRKRMTPIPAFARAALNDIRNSIFQRMRDILRRGGSDSYQQSVDGLKDGVDKRGSTMNAFIGMEVLTELLMMGRVGVYVDAPVIDQISTMADAPEIQPYVYKYCVEDILNWTKSGPDQKSQFKSILLRDTVMEYDQRTYLPSLMATRYRLMWIDELTKNVMVQLYDPEGNKIDSEGSPVTEPQMLQLQSIPFVLLDIGDSLLKDVSYYQIALLNLVSGNVSYDMKSNFPIMVEQRDLRAVGGHLKRVATEDGTASSGGQGAADENTKIGVSHGRIYGTGMDAPAFISPSSEPLKASMELQAKLESDIRRLINLAVTNIGVRASADSKEMDNQGLEAGLSFIGLVLENAERQIAKYWAAYENSKKNLQQVATVKYPDRYSLKTDGDRIKEAADLSKLINAVPGRTVKKEIGKLIVASLLGGKVSLETITKINSEIDRANYTTSDPRTIIDASAAGLVGTETASVALGFDKEEAAKAEESRIERVAATAEAQGIGKLTNPAARGVPDFSASPKMDAAAEKETSRNTDTKPTTEAPVRGQGKHTET